MKATCEVCRDKPARVRDFALRAGRWVEAEVCEDGARKGRRTPFAVLGIAAAAAALFGGAAIAIDAANRKNNPGAEPSAPPGPQPFSELGRMFRPGATTLAQYSRDLTDAAKKNELDPVIGRDDEVERVVSILARRSKNNPVLIGEPGVGKTAIVEGLAQRIARGSVPQALREKRVLALSLGPLVAGTKYRGEFESRVKKILDEVKRAGRDIILFIDELHTLVGAGAAEGSLDLSSMIKPELARGELQCIGATTFDEYRKYVESDAARVVGQDPAVRSVAEAIRRARAGLKDPRKPVGGFLFVGPSGVGKTELARALAHALFGTDDALIRLDLSEYTEAHTISRLLGAPPGYQGHEEPGQLTEPIRRRPYSVVLFDEIEKAHPDVAAILLQILDDGRVTDAKGRTIDFRHAIVVLTSNLDRDELEAALRPELLDRIDEVVYFKELGPRQIEQIVTLQVALLADRLGAHAMRLDLSDTARTFLAKESSSQGSGARYVARAIARHVTTPLSEAILRGRLASGHTARVDYDGSAITVEAAA